MEGKNKYEPTDCFRWDITQEYFSEKLSMTNNITGDGCKLQQWHWDDAGKVGRWVDVSVGGQIGDFEPLSEKMKRMLKTHLSIELNVKDTFNSDLKTVEVKVTFGGEEISSDFVEI